MKFSSVPRQINQSKRVRRSDNKFLTTCEWKGMRVILCVILKERKGHDDAMRCRDEFEHMKLRLLCVVDTIKVNFLYRIYWVSYKKCICVSEYCIHSFLNFQKWIHIFLFPFFCNCFQSVLVHWRRQQNRTVPKMTVSLAHSLRFSERKSLFGNIELFNKKKRENLVVFLWKKIISFESFGLRTPLIYLVLPPSTFY